eukprot:7845115-Ditylum_brightwellii.AAC.1
MNALAGAEKSASQKKDNADVLDNNLKVTDDSNMTSPNQCDTSMASETTELNEYEQPSNDIILGGETKGSGVKSNSEDTTDSFSGIESELDDDKSDITEKHELDGDGDNDHPLEGVPGFYDLPSPEEINDEGGDLPPEFIVNVESIIGRYRAKCFFSKNWLLREAALNKTSLLLNEIRNEIEMERYARVLCSMIERAVDDRVVQ